LKKSAIALVTLAVALCFSVSSFGAVLQSDYYYTNTPLLKVYRHSLGFKIIYRTGDMGTAEGYIPMKWFQVDFDDKGNRLPPKGELIYSHGQEVPYLVVFYKAGKFDHLKLYVDNDSNATSWGFINTQQDLTKLFDVTELKIQY
jgi:hypothetical protein